ncbi:MAG: glycosyltransferase family 4 protein [Deltaproteobacteria bacterium]|nr:glycosyltransferase family 4 protein [Deltaproteobacteria bacterium]
MLTILHTESSIGWGGQENRTLQECVWLKRLGARPIVLCKPDARLKERAEAAGIETRSHRLASNRDLSALRYILRLVKDEGVDVISTHSGDDSLIGAIAGRLSRRKPAIVRTRHLALPITSKITYLFAHKVVTVSEYVRRYLCEDKGIAEHRVVAIPTGVDLERFDPEKTPDTLRPELGISPDTPVAGTIAILRRKKGHHVLLDAIPLVLKEAPDALFLFAGDGPQRENIEKKTEELGVKGSVRLLGLRKDVPTVLKGIDLFVLPTLQEALGTSLIEASAMKKAVVAANSGGVSETIVNGKTGILVPPEDPAALAAAIIMLLKDRGARKTMGEAGRRMVEEKYTTERMGKAMFALYSELVSTRSQRA